MTGNKRAVIVLQDRDLRFLEELGTMRVVNREQASEVAGFHSTTRVNTRLLALTRAGLLKRVFIGSNEAAYMLSGSPVQNAGTLPAILFARHQLAINSVYLIIRHRPIPLPGTRSVRWVRFEEPISKTVALIPDAYFELDASGTLRCMFLEVDLGTEALTAWRHKTQGYLQLALSGEFQKAFGQPQFRVLVIADSERRLNNIRSTVAKRTDKIFRFATFESIDRDGFWTSIWLRPAGDQRSPLI
jgi:hypothetical protein